MPGVEPSTLHVALSLMDFLTTVQFYINLLRRGESDPCRMAYEAMLEPPPVYVAS